MENRNRKRKKIIKSKRFNIGLGIGSGACYFEYDDDDEDYKKNIIAYLGGPAVSLIIFFMVLPIALKINNVKGVNELYRNAVFFTFYLALVHAFFSILPIEYKFAKVKQSDGLQALRELKAMKREKLEKER